MSLQETLKNRAAVLAYLKATEQQAETDMGADNLTDDQWNAAALAFATARKDYNKALMGDGWKPFLADALANGF